MSNLFINIALILAEIIISYIALIFLSKKYKTDGIYVYAIIATFISCIMCLKKISIMNISVPIGFGTTTSLIIAGNLITQRRGLEDIKTLLLLILITAILSCCFLNLTGIIDSSDYNKFSNKSYDSIFSYNIRTYIAFIISTIVSIWLGSKLYYELKKLQNKIIISNVFSIVIIELLENILFILIADLFSCSTIDLILCIVLRYIIKTIIGLIGTIPLYISNKISQ